MSQIIKDEEELNTATDPDLRTEYFDLELLGLKSIVDLRKFSRSFMKIAKILFGIENNKLDKGDYTGNAKNLNDEISKKASSTQLGRMIVGTGLTDDGNGRVSHSTGAGNNHIPANGASGNFLKWLSNGVAQWANITWSDITGKPSTYTPASHTHDDKLDKGGYTGTAQNLLTEISKIASKTTLGRMIVGKGLTVDSYGRTSVVAKNDGIIVNDNDIQLNVYDGVDSTSTTRAASARAVKQANDNANGRVSKTGDEITGSLNFKLPQTRRAYGVDFLDYQGNDFGAIGAVTSGTGDGSLDMLYWGIGDAPWNNSNNNRAGIHMKDNNINIYGNVVSKLGITAPSFKGNADTATKLSTKRTLQIGSSSKQFDGSSDVSWTLSEIGAQPKTDNSLETESKDIVPAINESLWKMKFKPLNPGDNLDSLFVDGYYGGASGVLGLPANASEHIKSGRFVIFVLNSRAGDKPYEGYLKRQILFPVDGNNEIWTRYTGGQPTYREWVQVLTSDNRLFLGNAGISRIIFIQDSGTKTINEIYYDKDTGKPYRAKVTNTDITVTSKFEPADTKYNSTKMKNDFQIHLETGENLSSGNLLGGHPKVGYVYCMYASATSSVGSFRGGMIFWHGKTVKQQLNVGYNTGDNIEIRSDGTWSCSEGQRIGYVYSYRACDV